MTIEVRTARAGDGDALHRLVVALAEHQNEAELVTATPEALEKALEQKLGKALPINVDGAIAAVISDMGFDWRLGKGFFIISRVPGLLIRSG